jgi:hemin uptake protein HemP
MGAHPAEELWPLGTEGIRIHLAERDEYVAAESDTCCFTGAIDRHDAMKDERSEERSHRPGSAPAEGPIIYASEAIFRGRKEVWIEHGAEMYRLRITTAGKLYLTK